MKTKLIQRKKPIIDYIAKNYMGNMGMAVVAPQINQMLDRGIDVTPAMVDFMFDQSRNDWVTQRLVERAEKRSRRSNSKSDRGYVYFIENGDTVKIGYSRNPAERAKALSLREANILGVIEADQRFEKILHENWSAIRIGNTEWFEKTPELIEFIKSSAQSWYRNHKSKKGLQPQTIEESYLNLYKAIVNKS